MREIERGRERPREREREVVWAEVVLCLVVDTAGGLGFTCSRGSVVCVCVMTLFVLLYCTLSLHRLGTLQYRGLSVTHRYEDDICIISVQIINERSHV